MAKLHIIDIVSNKSKTPCLSEIAKGNKTVEGRKYSLKYQNIKKGDNILFILSKRKDGSIDPDFDMKELMVEVTYVYLYKTLEDYLNKEGYKKALPWTKNKEEALKDYNTWTKEKDRKELLRKYGYGFIGIGVKPVGHYTGNLQKTYYESIKKGEKTIEIRFDRDKWSKMNVGDIITFNKDLRVRINNIRKHKDIVTALKANTLRKTLPNIKTIQEGIEIYRKIPKYEDYMKEGILVLAVEIEVIN